MNHSISHLAAALILLAAPLAAQVHPGVTVRVHAPNHLIRHLDAAYLGRRGDTLLFGNDERAPIDDAFVMASVGVGAQLGAVIGAFIPKRRSVKVDPQLLLNLAGRPDRPSLGVRFAVAYTR